MELTELLKTTVKNGASDLHLSTNNPAILRVDGDMLPLQGGILSAEMVREMLYSVMTEEQRAVYEREMDVDFSITLGEMRFRVNAFNTLAGPAAVMRNVPTRIATLHELGAPELLKKLAMLKSGLILVTGPTGSGKSTTLAAMVDYINRNSKKHILTIEDPVEFLHVSNQSLVNHREVGETTKSFEAALRSALREDPDVIMVGEMRDLETIQLAITAAETGHLVMGTLHTSSAPKTIDRIIDVFPADSKSMIRSMLSVSIEAIITQQLVKRRSGGRVAAHEILLGTTAVRNLIREGKVPQIYSMMQVSTKVGMQTMKDCIYSLMNNNIISEEEARAAISTSIEEETGKNDGDGTNKVPGMRHGNRLGGTQGGF